MAWRQTGDKPLSEPIVTKFRDAYMHHSASIVVQLLHFSKSAPDVENHTIFMLTYFPNSFHTNETILIKVMAMSPLTVAWSSSSVWRHVLNFFCTVSQDSTLQAVQLPYTTYSWSYCSYMWRYIVIFVQPESVQCASYSLYHMQYGHMTTGETPVFIFTVDLKCSANFPIPRTTSVSRLLYHLPGITFRGDNCYISHDDGNFVPILAHYLAMPARIQLLLYHCPDTQDITTTLVWIFALGV